MRSSILAEQRRAAFLSLAKAMVETDGWLFRGDREGIETSVEKVASAFELYWRRCEEGRSESMPITPSAEAQVEALRSLSSFLTEVDELVSKGELHNLKAVLDQAKEAAELAAALDQAPHQSEIRSKFPGRIAK